MSEAKLEILASRAGLAVDWIDANGRPQHVQPDALRAVLKGLGHPADTDAEIEASLVELEQAQQSKHLPPLLTVDSGASLDLARYFEPDTLCRVHLEQGETLELRLDGNAVLPGVIALGYHQVQINDQTFTLAVAPTHCYSVAEAVDSQPARAWGISAQLYSLRRLNDGGFGDTLALEHLARAAAERGADALAIVTEWKAFRVPDFAQMARLLRDRMVFDGRNLYDPAVLARHGLGYQSIGRQAVSTAP